MHSPYLKTVCYSEPVICNLVPSITRRNSNCQPPDLSHEKANRHTKDDGEKGRQNRPLSTLSFLVDRINRCGARVMQQTEQHQIDRCEESPAARAE